MMGRIALFIALVAAVLLGGGRALLDVSLPAMHHVFASAAPELRLLVLQADSPGALPGVQAVVTLARPTQVGGRWLQPHPEGFARTQLRLGQVLQAPLLAGLLLLGWPVGALPVLAKRLALALGPLALLWLVDTPVVLAGMVWQLLLDAHAPGSGNVLTRTGDFLQGGGRLALAGAVACAAIAATQPCRRRETASTARQQASGPRLPSLH